VFLDMGWTRPFADLERDVGFVVRMVGEHLGTWPEAEANCQIQVLHSPFYRNKAAYVIGKGDPKASGDGRVTHVRALVPDYQLSLAIGKEGQNVRLAAKLTGAKIDVQPESILEGDD
jgi:hypothetical protein